MGKSAPDEQQGFGGELLNPYILITDTMFYMSYRQHQRQIKAGSLLFKLFNNTHIKINECNDVIITKVIVCGGSHATETVNKMFRSHTEHFLILLLIQKVSVLEVSVVRTSSGSRRSHSVRLEYVLKNIDTYENSRNYSLDVFGNFRFEKPHQRNSKFLTSFC